MLFSIVSIVISVSSVTCNQCLKCQVWGHKISKKSENFSKIWKLSSKSFFKNCHHEKGEHSHFPKSRPSKHYNGKRFTDNFIIVRKSTTSYHQNQVIWRDFRHCLLSNLTLSHYNGIWTYLPFLASPDALEVIVVTHWLTYSLTDR